MTCSSGRWGSADVPILGHGELVGGEPVVAIRIVVVQYAGLGAADGAVFAAKLDRHAVHEHPVEGAVARFQGGPFGPSELAEGFLDCLVGEVRVKQRECVSHTLLKHDLFVSLPLVFRLFTCAEFTTLLNHPSKGFQPCECSSFDGVR
jgi:hypothetical protein